MGRKRKHHDSISSEVSNSEKRAKNEDPEASAEETLSINASNSNYKVFLVKKPIGVSLEDLSSLKWDCGDEGVLAKTKFKTDQGSYRAVISLNNKKDRMLLLPAIREREESDSKSIKASSFVDGSVTILPQEVKKKYLGGSVYEEGEEPVEDAIPHQSLRKIKKVAVLDLESRRQRNKAYGTVTDAAGKPRLLSNIVKQ